MEKYAYMMEETDPVYFLSIKGMLPEISEEKQLMAEKITSIYMEWEKEADIKYPNIRRHGRPAEGIGVDGTVSVRNYLKCELYTYSVKTLALFILSIEHNPEYNRYLATMQKMVQAYGYSSLEELPELPRYKLDENKQIVIEDLIEEKEAPEPHEGEEGVKDEEDNKK